MIRVLIADDQRLVRAGLGLILRTEPDLEVVGEAADGVEAVETSRRLHPDVILMDIRMPRLNGIDATRKVVAQTPAPRVLILTTFDLDEYVYESLRAGASGFLLKDAPEQQLLTGIRTIVEGAALLDPEVTRRLIETFATRPTQSQPPEPLASLTPREIDVLVQLAMGGSNADLARTLHLSETTVKTHVARILAKLNLASRTQAAVLAYETRLVIPGRHPNQAPPPRSQQTNTPPTSRSSEG
jgi:DNA-binding NarL/FixJ family response regulator